MQRASVLDGIVPADRAVRAPDHGEAALNVATVYQDSLTRYWATELWDRVRQVIGNGGICRQSWRMSELTDPKVFSDAVQAAAAADVLVISMRDRGEWPMGLQLWFDAWLPKRAGRTGALVALIGVPGEPSAASGRAYSYLETAARQAGLDFLPRERKLPAESFALSAMPVVAPAASLAAA
jgi:hypothetical protein